MSLVDRKTFIGARRAGTPDLEETGARGAVAVPAGHPQAQARQATRVEPKPEPTGVRPPGPQRPAPPITRQAPIGPPQVAGKTGQPAPEREPPAFGWLVLLGAIFGLAVLKELLSRTAGPVVVKGVKSLPRLPASFWIAGGAGTLGRIGGRVLGR